MRELQVAYNPNVSRFLVERDRDIILDALSVFEQDPHALVPFEAHLPEVVGAVPESERKYFDNPSGHHLFSGFDWNNLPTELTETMEQINDDLRTLGGSIGDFTMSVGEFMVDDQRLSKHIDTGVVSSLQADDIFYLIANRHSILAHSGTGHLEFKTVRFIESIRLARGFQPVMTATAEDYQIIRCTRATVHESNEPPLGIMMKRRVLARLFFLH